MNYRNRAVKNSGVKKTMLAVAMGCLGTVDASDHKASMARLNVAKMAALAGFVAIDISC